MAKRRGSAEAVDRGLNLLGREPKDKRIKQSKRMREFVSA